MNRVLFCISVTICSQSFAQSSTDWLYEKQRASGNSTEYTARRTPTPKPTREEQSIEELKEILVEAFITPPEQEVNELICDAEISIEYTQMDDKVQVDAFISNQQCASSYGKYAIRVSTRDDFGQKHISNYEESWRLDNAAQTQVALIYDIGSDVELLSARIRGNARSFCTCVAEATESTAPEE